MPMIAYDYLVIGAGMGGVSVCEGIREYDPKGSILLATADPELPYHRPPLSKEFLSNPDIDPDSLRIHPAEWYAEMKIDLRLATLVNAFNIDRKLAVLGTGQALEFRKACLATGSRAFRPNVAGHSLGNVFYLRTLRDVLALRETLTAKSSVVIFGGGLLALEVAASLAMRKIKVKLIMSESAPWSNWLDAAGSEWLAQLFTTHQVELMTRESLNGFEGKTVLRNIQTKSGMRIAADAAIVALGAEPNLQLIPGTPLSMHGVTAVTETLETDEKGIFAVGDIASFPDKLFGGTRRWTHENCARAMGLIAGGNMTGRKRTRFQYLPVFDTKLFDYRIVFIGDPDRPATRVEREGDVQKGVFSLIRRHGDTAKAAILVNPSEEEEDRWKVEIQKTNSA